MLIEITTDEQDKKEYEEMLEREEMLESYKELISAKSKIKELERKVAELQPIGNKLQPKWGYWMSLTEDVNGMVIPFGNKWKCSHCFKNWETYDRINIEDTPDYCPNCGAFMKGTENYESKDKT